MSTNRGCIRLLAFCHVSTRKSVSLREFPTFPHVEKVAMANVRSVSAPQFEFVAKFAVDFARLVGIKMLGKGMATNSPKMACLDPMMRVLALSICRKV